MSTKFDSLPSKTAAKGDYALVQTQGGATSRALIDNFINPGDATQTTSGLMSGADKKKLDAITGGAATSVVLANGTTTTIAAMLQDNVDVIRTALGVATTEHMGLVPQLPSE